MPNDLQEDLYEILITGADKTKARAHLLSKGYDSDAVESELNQIEFANEENNSSEDSSKGTKSSKSKIISIGILLFVVLVLLKLFFFNQYRKQTYALIKVKICNTSNVPVVVETNISKALNSPYVNGGCLSAVIGEELPTDYLYSQQFYIKITVNGKSQTFSNENFGAITNMLSRAQINTSPGKEGFFSNQEIQYVTYTITPEDVAECK
ncbi:hypothetical protein [Cytophaga aurantiaca]|uniref:hypothetical protein n=1 Tax=Cytophaga aurantiaca TaxID=29530 RepID=UPI0003662DB3|nr:hypothetical protein [Cytophaga aurantiaca]